MNGKRIVISDDAADFLDACHHCLSEKGYGVSCCKQNGWEVLYAIHRECPDLVIMNIQMREIDAFAVLNALAAEERIPRFILVVDYIGSLTEPTVQKVQEWIRKKKSECRLLLRPVDIGVLLNQIEEMCIPEMISDHAEMTADKAMIGNILRQLGIPAYIKGFHYLCQAILWAAGGINLSPVKIEAFYPLLASTYDTTPPRIERAMRHAVAYAWECGNREMLSRYFGHIDYGYCEIPNHTDFIAVLAEQVQMIETEKRTDMAVR